MNEQTLEQNVTQVQVKSWKQRIGETVVQVVVFAAVGIATEMAAQAIMDGGRKVWDNIHKDEEFEEVDESIEEL